MAPALLPAKKGGFVKPRMAPCPPGFADAAHATAAAAEAEAAYDFELAEQGYLAAAHRAHGPQAIAAVAAYAVFAVQRYGQCAEVAAWLDDAAFAPPPDAKNADLTALWAAVAEAAAQTGHARSGEVDAQLAKLGDPAAQLRHAKRQDFARQQQRQAAQHHAKAQAEARSSHAAQLRQALEEHLDSGQLAVALDAARQLAQLPGAPEADKRWHAHIVGLLAAEELRAWVAAAQAAPVAEAWAILAQIAVARGAKVAVPFAAATDPLHTAWQVVQEAAACLSTQPITQRIPALQALAQLRQLLADRADVALIRPVVDRLPADWRGSPTAKTALQHVAQAEAAEKIAQNQAFVQHVQAMIDDGELDDAAAALQAHAAQQAPTAAIKALRGELLAARQVRVRTAILRQDFEAALQRTAWFAARATLAELVHVLPQAEIALLRDRLDAAAGPNLRGTMMPPGVQKLDATKPFAAEVVAGRLIIAQGDIWFSVALDTLGLQPFALPPQFQLQAAASVAMAYVEGELRATAIAHQRLISIGHGPPDPPEIRGGMELATALGGDDRLLSTACDPAAAQWQLLSAHSARPGQTHLVTVDSQTLHVLARRRTSPSLLSLCAVRHRPGVVLATSHPPQRQGKVWSVALLGADGTPVVQWSDHQLGESIGHIQRAIAWPDRDRIFASFDTVDPFAPQTLVQAPSLLVLSGDRVTFCSADLRRRFFPMAQLTVDHAWTLDAAAGRLWFAALPKDEPGGDALLLGVDAQTLRAAQPEPIAGAARIVALLAVPGGAVGVCRMHAGHYALLRATPTASGFQLTTHRLPL